VQALQRFFSLPIGGCPASKKSQRLPKVPFTFQVCKGARQPSPILREAIRAAHKSTSAARDDAASSNSRKKEARFQLHLVRETLLISRKPSPPSQKMLRAASLKVVVPQTLKASKILIYTLDTPKVGRLHNAQ